MDKKKRFNEIVKGIKEIRIQGARNIAKSALKAYQLIPTKQSKQKLSEKQIKDIAKICLNIEKHYKFPQDIEWALEKGKFYIVQSRPITTL